MFKVKLELCFGSQSCKEGRDIIALLTPPADMFRRSVARYALLKSYWSEVNKEGVEANFVCRWVPSLHDFGSGSRETLCFPDIEFYAAQVSCTVSFETHRKTCYILNASIFVRVYGRLTHYESTSYTLESFAGLVNLIEMILKHSGKNDICDQIFQIVPPSMTSWPRTASRPFNADQWTKTPQALGNSPKNPKVFQFNSRAHY